MQVVVVTGEYRVLLEVNLDIKIAWRATINAMFTFTNQPYTITLIDARRKPWYPEELFADDATAATVTRRWREYFPGGGVEMGDSGLAHLDPAG